MPEHDRKGEHVTVHFPECGSVPLMSRVRNWTFMGWGGVNNGGYELSYRNKLFLTFLERARFKKMGPEKRKRREVLQIPQ